MKIRQMLYSDMPAVWAVQCACYQQVLEPESIDALEAKRSASPTSCFVVVNDDGVQGYLIAIPWLFAQVPSLNDPSCQLPCGADCLYLHDMAISPKMAGQGIGQMLFSGYQKIARELGFFKLALTAVGDAERYWKKLGFKVLDIKLSQQKVAAYGGQVTYMYQDC
ncbi:GNAT family N-acetyltransferase [Nitrincola schmidtii]|uniref:GNAT family N-acetyltransferase n=1 Tax=Nitrincola schmidtii TaxID=1730894 RepID=UPI00124E237F|nr:GNAT family N-acetyltransferase [Nitrincola schmidtii]